MVDSLSAHQAAGIDSPPTYVLGFTPTGLTIARSLGRQGVPVIGVHDNPNEPCIRSRYARVHILPPIEEHEQAWLDFLLEQGRINAPRKAVLLVGTDWHWLFVARYRRQLSPYFLFPLPATDEPERYMAKPFQYAAAARAGVPFPRTWYPRNLREVEEASEQMLYPCLLKPALSHQWAQHYGLKLTLVHNRRQLLTRGRDALSRKLKFMIQEYIPAEDDQIYALYSYLDRSSQPFGKCVSRKVRQFEPRFGSSCCSVSVDEPDVERLALRLLQTMGFHGLSSVEFKLDPRDGRFKLMEVNVRAPLMMAVAVDSGVNLAHIAYRDLCGQPALPAEPLRLGRRVGILAYDIHSARFYHRLGCLPIWRWLLSWLRTRDIHFAWDDLGPMRGYIHSMLDQLKRGKYRQLPTYFPTIAEWQAMNAAGQVHEGRQRATPEARPVERVSLR